jgi:dynein heavy chain
VPPGSLPARPLYEFYFDARAAEWRSWGSQVGPYVPPPDGAFAKILVPTVDIVR